MDFEHSIIVRTPLKDVFNYLSNLRNQQEFRTDMNISVETVALTATTKYVERFRFLGLSWKQNFEIASFERNQQIITKSVLGWLPLEQHFKLNKVKEGTQIQWKIKMKVKGIFRFFKPYLQSKMRKQFMANINLLKETLDFKLSNAFFLTYANSNAKNWL